MVGAINDEFRQLRRLYRCDGDLNALLVQAAPDASASFGDAWAPILDFFGTLGAVFPGTSAVESDFSILK